MPRLRPGSDDEPGSLLQLVIMTGSTSNKSADNISLLILLM
ncbi:MAG: hypothetical protein WBH40_15545 [Ignavibacteriaceae bacterium]